MAEGNGEHVGATRVELLAFTDRPSKVEWVEIPELDSGGVHIRVMRGCERDAWQASSIIDHGDGRVDTNHTNISARFACYIVCDKSGKLLFGPSDVPAVGKLPGVVLDRIWEAGKRLNRVGKQSGSAEDAAKNSKAAASA